MTEVREYEHTRSYAEGIKSLANEYGKGVAVLDAFSLIEKEGQKKGGLDEFFYE